MSEPNRQPRKRGTHLDFNLHKFKSSIVKVAPVKLVVLTAKLARRARAPRIRVSPRHSTSQRALAAAICTRRRAHAHHATGGTRLRLLRPRGDTPRVLWEGGLLLPAIRIEVVVVELSEPTGVGCHSTFGTGRFHGR